MSSSTPVWIWLPGSPQPTLAAELKGVAGSSHWIYTSEYLSQSDRFAPDPVQLGLTSKSRGIFIRDADGLPGVVRDAAPAGYGADRLEMKAGRSLSALERLEQGPADGVGAIEVCKNIQHKLDWKPARLADLEDIARHLGDTEPSSRAIRQLQNDPGTSAGGERPKTTVYADHALWLAKMQDRGDIPWLPAKEFVAMSLARDLDDQPDLRVPQMRYVTAGAHAIFLIQRFDRSITPGAQTSDRPAVTRSAYASAHTALRLRLDSVVGDPARSYLGLADELRRWDRSSPWADDDCAQLWRRMVTNALIGNTDDHPRNHGFLLEDGYWRLSPLFDVTPTATTHPVQRMAVGSDGSGIPDLQRLLGSAAHFGITLEDAASWLIAKSSFIARSWQARLRSLGVPDDEIARTEPAFSLSHTLAEQPELVKQACDAISSSPHRLRQRMR